MAVLEGNFSQEANSIRERDEGGRKAFRSLTFLAISLPVVMLCLTSLHRGLSHLADHLCTGRLRSCASAIDNILSFIILLGLAIGATASLPTAQC